MMEKLFQCPVGKIATVLLVKVDDWFFPEESPLRVSSKQRRISESFCVFVTNVITPAGVAGTLSMSMILRCDVSRGKKPIVFDWSRFQRSENVTKKMSIGSLGFTTSVT